MKLDRVAALRAERNAVMDFCRDLSPTEWEAPSRCEGWTVHDVVAHMGAAYHGTFGWWVIKLMLSKDVEAGNDRDAAARRSWPPEKVLGEYERWSRRFLRIAGLLQTRPAAAMPIRLAEVGTYPARLLASALTFDHHLHLRYDLATALDRPVPAAQPGVLSVVLEWMWAGVPGMSVETLAWLDRSVTVTLLGPEGGTWSVVAASGGRVAVKPGPVDDVAATVTADAEHFPIWATRRQSWRDSSVKVEGDEEFGAHFLDTLRII
jgi:uncharacterized protein (TIGR03083 family)